MEEGVGSFSGLEGRNEFPVLLLNDFDWMPAAHGTTGNSVPDRKVENEIKLSSEV